MAQLTKIHNDGCVRFSSTGHTFLHGERLFNPGLFLSSKNHSAEISPANWGRPARKLLDFCEPRAKFARIPAATRLTSREMSQLNLQHSTWARLLKGVMVLLLVALGSVSSASPIGVPVCKMAGMSARTPSCHGCCGAMKCCTVSTKTEQSQPAGPQSSGRQDFQLDPLLVRAVAFFTIHEACPNSEIRSNVPQDSSPSRAFLSLAQLCIRLT